MIKPLIKAVSAAFLLLVAVTGCSEDGADVTVTGIKVTGVTISNPTLEMAIDDTYTLTADVTPSNATNRSVAWTSSNSAIASVDGAGNVVAWSKGTTIISVVTADVDYVAHCTVVVVETDSSTTGDSSSESSNADNSEDMEQGTGFGN